MEPDVHFIDLDSTVSIGGSTLCVCGATMRDTLSSDVWGYVVGRGYEHSNWKHVTCMGCVLVRFSALEEAQDGT